MSPNDAPRSYENLNNCAYGMFLYARVRAKLLDLGIWAIFLEKEKKEMFFTLCWSMRNLSVYAPTQELH